MGGEESNRKRTSERQAILGQETVSDKSSIGSPDRRTNRVEAEMVGLQGVIDNLQIFPYKS